MYDRSWYLSMWALVSFTILLEALVFHMCWPEGKTVIWLAAGTTEAILTYQWLYKRRNQK